MIPEEREEALAALLESLANPTRLALLRQLRQPRILSEIRLRAEQPREGLNPERAMARQAVRRHLDYLLDAGFVRKRSGWRGELEVEEYIVNHQRLFAVLEDLRGLGQLRPVDLTWNEQTVSLTGLDEQSLPDGPQLILVRGLGEGLSYALRVDGRAAGEWIIGRQRGLAIPLDYDPFVSGEHARVVLDDKGFFVEDLPTSRNGTFLNWQPLPRGGRAALAHGDMIGVGRSLLLFRA